MKYKIIIYGFITFLACQETARYNYELRTWKWTGSDTLIKNDTIKLFSKKSRNSKDFNGYYDAGVEFNKQYYIDSLIAENIHLLKNGDTLIKNQHLHLELLSSKSFDFQDKKITIYKIYIDYAPFSPIGGPVVLFAENFGVIYREHAHGRYILNLNTIRKVNDKNNKEVQLEDFVDKVTNDTILFSLPPMIPQPEIVEIPDESNIEEDTQR
jgi:hypothetical protein